MVRAEGLIKNARDCPTIARTNDSLIVNPNRDMDTRGRHRLSVYVSLIARFSKYKLAITPRVAELVGYLHKQG